MAGKVFFSVSMSLDGFIAPESMPVEDELFAPDGAATRIEMRTVFPTKQLRDQAVEKYHAIEGGEQTLRNLAAYLTETGQEGTVR